MSKKLGSEPDIYSADGGIFRKYFETHEVERQDFENWYRKVLNNIFKEALDKQVYERCNPERCENCKHRKIWYAGSSLEAQVCTNADSSHYEQKINPYYKCLFWESNKDNGK